MRIKEDLLGKITKLNATGDHKLSLGELNEPLDWGMAIIFSYCTGCGVKLEHNLEGAKKLANEAKVQLPSNLKGYYFETTQCLLCGDSNQNVKLKKFRI